MSIAVATLLLKLASPAVAGEVVIDARVPVEITIDGHLRAKLYDAGTLRLAADTGKRSVTLFVNGEPQALEVDVPETGAVSILVGRTGISTTLGNPEPAKSTEGPSTVQFHAAGREELVVQVDAERHRIEPGQSLALVLASGDHKLSVRDSSGTTIWARGVLAVGTGDLVVQVVEGRMPETTGDGGSFRPDGG